MPILHVWITAFIGLVIFGAAGLAATSFLPDRRVSMMAAPLAEIALWPLATLALYVGSPPGLGVDFDSAARFAIAALVILALVLVPLNRASFAAAWRFLAIVAIVSVIIAPIIMIASVERGEPALLYLDGADHGAYSKMADWYRSHPPQMVIKGTVGPAVNDPTQPYLSAAQLLFEADVRGGAFAYVALMSILTGQPGLFSFDAALTVAFIAACLGCAAVFTRSWKYLLCLSTALLTSLWYDYGHMGFFGKLLSYPMALFTFGVFLSFYRSNAGPGEALRDADRKQMFAVSDFDRLQAAIGDQEVYIDLDGNIRTIGPIVVEFGRRNIKTVWSPHSWSVIGEFRGAAVPPVAKMPDLHLIDATARERPQEHIVVETRRYKLVRRSGTPSDRHRKEHQPSASN